MRLTKFTDVALRAVMRLAAVEQATPPTTQEVADAVSVPFTHMAKAVSRLRAMGVLDTRRGRGGGLELTELGRTASVGWLVRELEGDDEVVSCDGDSPCPLRGACRLRAALRDAQEAFHASLDAVTVADLISPPTRAVLIGLVGDRPG